MNTRQYDLEKMEEAGVDPKRIDAVYRQSKDQELEYMRKALIEAHKKRDVVTADQIAAAIKRRGF